MKREKKWDKVQKLRALVVELVVVAEDMEEYRRSVLDFYPLFICCRASCAP